MIYLDYSANTPADPAVPEAFCRTEQTYIGNPNSTHPAGQAAQAEMTRVTESIAGLLRVSPEEIIYTSGASESNNLALKGIVQVSRAARWIWWISGGTARSIWSSCGSFCEKIRCWFPSARRTANWEPSSPSGRLERF